jgi:hypothetical protein
LFYQCGSIDDDMDSLVCGRCDEVISAKKPMCGRFSNRLTWREIVALYRLSVPLVPERNLPARYNICPTDLINVVVEA